MRIAIALLVASGAMLPAAGQTRMGSLYDPGEAPIRMGTNNTARRAGDLVTVMIMEDQQLKNEEKTDLQKVSGLDYAISDFGLKPDAFSTLPSLRGDRNDSFAGSANYEKKGAFTAKLTAIVVDTLPNDNLVIKGRREIRIDGEVKVMEISGIVRRFDVRADNTILSESVADARITYSGSGPLTRATNRRGLGAWIHDALDWLWPF